jgi:general secretion pathway protein G
MVLIESTQKATRKGGERVNKWLQALLRRTNGEKGVTLIELLAVIVIIAVIAAIAVPMVLGAIKNSKTNTAKQDMTIIAEALNRYAADNNGQFPTANAWTPASQALSSLTGSGSTAYLQNVPKDPWDSTKDFYYWSDGTNFELETAIARNGSGASTGDKLYLSNKMAAPSNSVPGLGQGIDPDSTHTW